ncbi:MAG TPA: hypothetical protein VKB09_01715 [Thermomicrobiales bacterium]|nr:hypothetical protein [Thermomicrobiales bacterium]
MNGETDGRRDFDFFHGRWRIHNRRLARRLQGCTDWQEFEATQECYPVIGGFGNVDHFYGAFPDGEPIEGMSVRLFDPMTRLWSIYWTDNRVCQLLPPVVGRFDAGRGKFFGDDVCDGTPVRVVYHWTDITPTSARWEQEFSADDGETWESNWVMTMTRVE